MHRRKILANIGLLLMYPLVGCLGTFPGGASPDNRIEEVVTDSSSDLPLVPSVSIVKAESTEEQPMSISVKWENQQEETLRFGEERSAMFHAAMSDDETAYLLSDDYGSWEDVVTLDECWYVSGEVGGSGVYQVRELEPEESHETKLHLYAARDDCFKNDTYRFQTSISVGTLDEHPENRPSKDWGFTIHIDDS